MKFTDTHEWIEVDNGVGTVGVSDHAQKELGDIVYVELPQVGKEVKAGQEAAVLESTKAAADVYSPASGVITEVNNALTNSSELVNRSPQKEGWIYKIKLTNSSELDALQDEATYLTKIAGH
jgi:glycine cleavage system H protein